MNGFLELVAEILEVDASTLSGATDFRSDVPDWDSMRGFSILCMIEDEYGVRMEVPEFLECVTIDQLYRAAGSPTE